VFQVLLNLSANVHGTAVGNGDRHDTCAMLSQADAPRRRKRGHGQQVERQRALDNDATDDDLDVTARHPNHRRPIVIAIRTICATVGAGAPFAMSTITIAGAIPSASRSAVVESFASIATLTPTMAASAALEPTINDDRKTVFMVSTPFGSLRM